MANEKIYLGLNIEPENISWAVANNDYQLCKYDKRIMWGVYNFDEAQLSDISVRREEYLCVKNYLQKLSIKKIKIFY